MNTLGITYNRKTCIRCILKAVVGKMKLAARTKPLLSLFLWTKPNNDLKFTVARHPVVIDGGYATTCLTSERDDTPLAWSYAFKSCSSGTVWLSHILLYHRCQCTT